MLPEVRFPMTMRFQNSANSLRRLRTVSSFENKPLECYKSDLRHALCFAYTWQFTGFRCLYLQALNKSCLPGRGSRSVASAFALFLSGGHFRLVLASAW